MSSSPSPRLILQTLLPHLRIAAAYARQIQSRIVAQPVKEAENFIAAALSDADLSIQTLVEVALLGSFPSIRFYGEEYERSYNTKYFRAIDLGEQDDYLVTLDPIDGTQFYLDGHSNYQIILNVLNRDEYEAVLAITPIRETYCYALRGQGCWYGSLTADLDDCHPLHLKPPDLPLPSLFLGWGMESLAPELNQNYTVISITQDYSQAAQIPIMNGLLTGDLVGAVTRSGSWLDSAAIAFLAQEAGAIVTTLKGQPLPPLYTSQNYKRPGLIMAATPKIHQDLQQAITTTIATRELPPGTLWE